VTEPLDRLKEKMKNKNQKLNLKTLTEKAVERSMKVLNKKKVQGQMD
jgi:hypothetical protein